jgi:hypothetical protein
MTDAKPATVLMVASYIGLIDPRRSEDPGKPWSET